MLMDDVVLLESFSLAALCTGVALAVQVFGDYEWNSNGIASNTVN